MEGMGKMATHEAGASRSAARPLGNDTSAVINTIRLADGLRFK